MYIYIYIIFFVRRIKCCPPCCPDKSESKASDYELSARTVKALQDIIFTEAKM